MGFAVAAEAARRGAEVMLVAGPTTVVPPRVTELVKVRSAAEMHRAVMERVDRADVVIMAAAVADYSPAERAPQKVHKEGETLTLVLRKTPDILGELGRRRLASGHGPLLVGFAAETERVEEQGAAKRRNKHADLIVANDVARTDAGFEVDANAVTIVGEQRSETLPLLPKSRVAAEILDRVEGLMAESPARAKST
jgi:phosphopantothenoylcysteine decarboxylase/phosphopantothenate--cysteine ligase